MCFDDEKLIKIKFIISKLKLNIVEELDNIQVPNEMMIMIIYGEYVLILKLHKLILHIDDYFLVSIMNTAK